MSVSMWITIAFYGVLVLGYFYVVGKVWRGQSELDPDNAPAFWPFGLPLWRGVGRALPVQGLSVLVLIGGGIAGDLVGSGSAGNDLAMGIGLIGMLGLLFLAFPITFLNRPKLLVPPHQRHEPGALAEWRLERDRRTSRKR